MDSTVPMPPDLREFLASLREGTGPVADSLQGWFEPGEEIVVARAPGRLDVMGGIADYSGSLVLQLPTAEATFAAVRKEKDRTLRIVSCSPDADAPPRAFAMPVKEMLAGEASRYDLCRSYFQRGPEDRWAAYVVGAVLVLMKEKGVQFDGGLRVAVASRVPEGKGVASSAALEVASMAAIAELVGLALDPVEMAILCQKVENLVVGAPCGVMDQITAACGREGQLLALLCQPADLLGHVAIPPGIAFWGIDSGIRHAVSGADYTSVRVGAFMGYRIIAERAGLKTYPADARQVVTVEDGRWKGYLANIAPPIFERQFAPHLPTTLEGRRFLEQYHGTTDPVTRVMPERTYAVFQPTAHAVYEHARVNKYRELLGGPADNESLAALGRLMVESHESYSACGLGSDGTDLLVDLVRTSGPASGLFGAKITGGGSGGTVAILGRAEAGEEVHRIARRYAERTGRRLHVFAGSSDGAATTGCYHFRL